MEFLGWWTTVALLVLLLAREVVWRRRMHAVIEGVRTLQRELRGTLQPWGPGQLSKDTGTSVLRKEPPHPSVLGQVSKDTWTSVQARPEPRE